MDKITLAGDVGGGVDKFIATQESTNPASWSTKTHVAIDSLSDKAKPVVDKLADAAHVATHNTATAASDTLDWLLQQSSNLSEVRAKLLEQTKTYVSENPVKAIALGVVAGMLLTHLLSEDDSEDDSEG